MKDPVLHVASFMVVLGEPRAKIHFDTAPLAVIGAHTKIVSVGINIRRYPEMKAFSNPWNVEVIVPYFIKGCKVGFPQIIARIGIVEDLAQLPFKDDFFV